MAEYVTPHYPSVFMRRPSLAHWARSVVLKRLEQITWGRIVLRDEGHEILLGSGSHPQVTVDIHDPSFYSALAWGGSVGAGEAYMAGLWSSNHLTDLIRILVRNRSVLSAVDGGWVHLVQPTRRLFHWLHRNTQKGSRRNIKAHYDLGNDFYQLFLDKSMTYSSGIFTHPGATLLEASTKKYDRLCRKLNLSSEDHVIEIGGGWGGFAQHAVKHYGCRVTTTTISQEQFNYMQERFNRAGITDRITLLCDDYRELRGRYDKLVSIEMIEAVGHDFQPTFLKQCSNLLKRDGIMALQAITIRDQLYAQHLRTVDFIKRYIFPGSCLTSIAHLCKIATGHTDLRLSHLEDIGLHYAKTLRLWRENFLARAQQIQALGYNDAFMRMWEYYLSYCEGAFTEQYISDVQMVFTKPLNHKMLR